MRNELNLAPYRLAMDSACVLDQSSLWEVVPREQCYAGGYTKVISEGCTLGGLTRTLTVHDCSGAHCSACGKYLRPADRDDEYGSDEETLYGAGAVACTCDGWFKAPVVWPAQAHIEFTAGSTDPLSIEVTQATGFDVRPFELARLQPETLQHLANATMFAQQWLARMDDAARANADRDTGDEHSAPRAAWRSALARLDAQLDPLMLDLRESGRATL